MSNIFRFVSRVRNFRTWVGQTRVEFNNGMFETSDQRIASAIRERLSTPKPRGLKGEVSEIPTPAPAVAPVVAPEPATPTAPPVVATPAPEEAKPVESKTPEPSSKKK